MKCICGHKNKHNELDEEFNLIKEKNNKFIKINGMFNITSMEIMLNENEIKEVGEKILKLRKNIIDDVDDTILDYVDEDWENDGEYETEYDWYVDYGRNEAEDQVINDAVNQYEINNKVKFDIDTFVAIGKYVANKVGINY